MVYFSPLVRGGALSKGPLVVLRGGALSKGPLVVLNTICFTVRRPYIPETCGGEELVLIWGEERG